MSSQKQVDSWAEQLKTEIRAYGRKCVRGYAAGLRSIDVDTTWTNIEKLIASAPNREPAGREAELLARIHQLEERAAQAAELVSKAVEMIAPPKKSEAAHEWRGPAHDGETGPA